VSCAKELAQFDLELAKWGELRWRVVSGENLQVVFLHGSQPQDRGDGAGGLGLVVALLGVAQQRQGVGQAGQIEQQELLQPLCLFKAVEAERVSIIHPWNDSTCARVTAQGSSAAASASGSGECSARYRPSWRQGRGPSPDPLQRLDHYREHP